MYERGTSIIQQNQLEAVRWYTKSAENGNSVAQFVLAFKFRRTTSKGLALHIKWITTAASQGDSWACINSG
jgi:TPR repeat protein